MASQVGSAPEVPVAVQRKTTIALTLASNALLAFVAIQCFVPFLLAKGFVAEETLLFVLVVLSILKRECVMACECLLPDGNLASPLPEILCSLVMMCVYVAARYQTKDWSIRASGSGLTACVWAVCTATAWYAIPVYCNYQYRKRELSLCAVGTRTHCV